MAELTTMPFKTSFYTGNSYSVSLTLTDISQYRDLDHQMITVQNGILFNSSTYLTDENRM